MTKGRGSNKTGRGPTPPKKQDKPQMVSQVQLELMTLQRMYDQKVNEINALRANLEYLGNILRAVLLTKQGLRAVVKPSQIEKIPQFQINPPTEDENGNLIIEMVPAEANDAKE